MTQSISQFKKQSISQKKSLTFRLTRKINYLTLVFMKSIILANYFPYQYFQLFSLYFIAVCSFLASAIAIYCDKASKTIKVFTICLGMLSLVLKTS